MSNGSPSAFLLWAVLSVCLQAFLICHLWRYDKFKCLRWNSGRQPGTFKRVMTYSYIFNTPLLSAFSIMFTVAKYTEGYVLLPDMTIQPRPYSLWTGHTRAMYLPLNYIFSTSWGLELVTHLEELTFWLFLLHQGPQKRVWFHSWEFRTWYIGSLVAIMGLPLTTYSVKDHTDFVQGWIFLVGASASTMTTICFLYVIARFPRFISQVKLGGAPPDVIGRLEVFYRLNLYRVIFRIFFSVPLLILGIDSMRKQHEVIGSSFWADILLMIGGIGCFASTTLTLLIFFPREDMQPCACRHQQQEQSPTNGGQTRAMQGDTSQSSSKMWTTSIVEQTSEDTMWDRGSMHSPAGRGRRPRDNASEFDDGGPADVDSAIDLESLSEERQQRVTGRTQSEWDRRQQRRMRRKRAMSLPASLETGHHPDSDVNWAERGTIVWVHPYILTFTSPIDLPHIELDQQNTEIAVRVI